MLCVLCFVMLVLNMRNDLMFSMLGNNPYYMPNEEIPNVADYESSETSRGTSKEMDLVRDRIASQIWSRK